MSVLGDLSRSLEAATDEYVVALDLETEAENAFLKVQATAFLHAKVSGVAATILTKFADAQAVEERMAWNLAVARRRRCWAKCDELKNRIMASMSHNKLVGSQT